MSKNVGIENYIPVGHDNGITKSELMQLTGLSERDVREHISGARKRGTVILNLQDGSGYFQPTVDEYLMAKQQYNQEKSRAMKILKNNSELRKWIEDVEKKRIC